MRITFEDAKIEEAEALSDLAILSKGYWGHPKELLELWRKDLRIEPDYIEKNVVRTIWSGSDRVGFFAIKKEEENILDHLWLLPEAIGKGVGARAFREIEKECIRLGIDEFIIISDPDAEGFYLHRGAQRIGEVQSVPQNRCLPKLLYRINQAERNKSLEDDRGAASAPRANRCLAEARRLWPSIGAQAFVPVGDGWACETYEVDGRWIVQFPRTTYAERALLKQLAVLPQLRRRLRIAIPSPVPSASPGAPAMLYRKIHGEPFTNRPPGAWPEQLGAMVRELQTIPPSSIGLSDRSVDSLRRERHEQLGVMTDQVLPLLGAGDREELEQLFSDYLRNEAVWQFKPVPVHNDLGPPHILVDESGHLAGVIDWEELSVGDPAADLAWIMGKFPAIGRRVLEAFGGQVNSRFNMRAGFLYLLMPFYEVIYGQESRQQAFIESGLAGIVSRLRWYQGDNST